jgi:hypothetical protein
MQNAPKIQNRHSGFGRNAAFDRNALVCKIYKKHPGQLVRLQPPAAANAPGIAHFVAAH